MATEIFFKEESYAIVGACMAVHSILGSGFLESVYQEALGREFVQRGIPFEKEKKLRVVYNDIILDKYFKADFVCYQEIIVELKAVSFLPNVLYLQVLNYLRAANKKIGLLVNFGEKSLVYKRVLNSHYSSNP